MRLPAQLLQRRRDSNKGDFGHILVIAGSARYSGAAILTAEACLRSGAGLVTLAIPEGLNSAVIRIKAREIMTLPLPQNNDGSLNLKGFNNIRDFSADVIALGPGLGRNKSTLALARKIILSIKKRIVIDADALRALVGNLKLLPRDAVLTPHPGEMAALLGISVRSVQGKRKDTAIKFAKRYGVTLVLKGHDTVVSGSDGSVYINKTGNPGMSTAGCGDVLTGIIAAFLGQGLNAFDAAKYGVYLHGKAGDLAAGDLTEISLIASDIIDKIPEAVKRSS